MPKPGLRHVPRMPGHPVTINPKPVSGTISSREQHAMSIVSGTTDKPKRYSKKPETCEAMQITPDNLRAVASWCGGRVESEGKASDPTDIYVTVKLATFDGVQQGRKGDYIVKDLATGQFSIWLVDAFESAYQVIGTRDEPVYREPRS